MSSEQMCSILTDKLVTITWFILKNIYKLARLNVTTHKYTTLIAKVLLIEE